MALIMPAVVDGSASCSSGAEASAGLSAVDDDGSDTSAGFSAVDDDGSDTSNASLAGWSPAAASSSAKGRWAEARLRLKASSALGPAAGGEEELDSARTSIAEGQLSALASQKHLIEEEEHHLAEAKQANALRSARQRVLRRGRGLERHSRLVGETGRLIKEAVKRKLQVAPRMPPRSHAHRRRAAGVPPCSP